MIPSQKAKEIIDRYGEYLVKEFKNEPSVDKWLATPQAAAILSGEDWEAAANSKMQDADLNKLYEWVMDENRQNAETYFTAGIARNVAREIQYRLSGEDWISVEKPPDIGDEYLVVYDLEDGDEPLTTAMQFDAKENKWYDERAAGAECKTVLFWMPLPEPPKP